MNYENKIACVLAHGKSIEQLEEKIIQLKSCNVLYITMGLFTIIEDFILSKIDKHLDIVFDCATVAGPFLHNYENNVRLPRLAKFLDRKEDNLWITTHGIVRDSLIGLNRRDFLIQYNDKIFVVDNIFPKDNIAHYMDVPNSLCLLIAFLLYSKVRKIILFGFDGCSKERDNLDTYYKPEYHKQEHLVATGSIGITDLKRDTVDFEKRFLQKLQEYRKLFNNQAEIVNCSLNTIYNCIRKVTYENLRREL